MITIDSNKIEAQRLFDSYVSTFRETDMALTYTQSEQVVERELEQGVWLVGQVDARGVRPDGVTFFREDKTANPRGRATWKRHWVMSVQALTYALLTGERTFLVRKVFKNADADCEQEWFALSEDEVRMWEFQVLHIAGEIRNYRKSWGGVWPLNIEHGCFQFGEKYPCPFYAEGCSKLNFGRLPSLADTKWHLALSDRLSDPSLIVLDATRIKAWMRCRQYYKRTYGIGGQVGPDGDALIVGKMFHDLASNYTKGLIKEKNDGKKD